MVLAAGSTAPVSELITLIIEGAATSRGHGRFAFVHTIGENYQINHADLQIVWVLHKIWLRKIKDKIKLADQLRQLRELVTK